MHSMRPNDKTGNKQAIVPERDYRPISCSLYDVLEAAALKKRMLTLTIDGQELTLVIDDVFARGKEEFLDGTNPLT